MLCFDWNLQLIKFYTNLPFPHVDFIGEAQGVNWIAGLAPNLF
jgi:hypothetical protein